MIMGVNLTDKIYLAADSRVTYTGPSTTKYEDNVIKIVGLKNSPEYQLTVAVAGDVELATFLAGTLSFNLKHGTIPLNIEKLEPTLKLFFQKCINEWYKQRKIREGLLTYMLVGAVDFTKRKVPSKEKIDSLLEHFMLHTEEQKKTRWKVEKSVLKDPIIKMLNQKLLEQRGKGVMEELVENDNPKFHPKIQAVLNGNTDPELQPFHTLLVGSLVDVNNRTVHTEVANWGEGLVKGGGVRPDALRPDMQAVFEFGTRQLQKEGDNMLECAFIGTTILDYAKKENLSGIGGNVAVGILSKRGLRLSGQNFRFEGENVFAKVNGVEVPMQFFHQMGGKGGLL